MALANHVTAAHPIKLEVKDLNFYYGKFHALKHVNLAIQQNKVTAFIGPSGCGKSTLLRTFNRMFELYPGQRAEGQILLDGEDLLHSRLDISLIRAKVGMVFQKPTPFPMSIYDNIAFGVRLFERLSKGEMQSRAVGRGQRQARPKRQQLVGRPAAAPVHRARRGHQTRSAAARRTLLRPGPDFHRQNRRANRGIEV